MTSLRAKPNVVITGDLAAQIDRALSKTIAEMVAAADDTPYPDAPQWSRWTRFQKPLANRCKEVRSALREAVKAAS